MRANRELLAGYIPVLHAGYIEAFNRHPDAIIGIFNAEILSSVDYLRKDIRALSPEDAKLVINGLGRKAVVMGQSALDAALKEPLIMPDDDISRSLMTANPDSDITLEPVFLRWDRLNTTKLSSITPDRVVRPEGNDPILQALSTERFHSTNWWRHVAAAVVDDHRNIKLIRHSTSLPTEYTSLIESDPRITARKGRLIEQSIDVHAEAMIIAEASRRGIALEGQSIYVSTFPCPNCAKLIALSGISSCYFIDGYSLLDGYSILKNFGVEVVRLDTKLQADDPRTLRPYPTSQS